MRLYSFFLFGLLVIFSFTAGSDANAQRSLAEGFTKFDLQSSRQKYAYSRAKFPDGRRAERFELRSGDCPRATDDCNTDRERVEFSEKKPGIRLGKEMWVAWSVYLPRDFPRVRAPNGWIATMLGQFHQKGNSGPELMFHLTDSEYILHLADPHHLTNDPMNPHKELAWKPIYRRSQMIGKWTRIMVNANWSRESDGFIRVWINGKQVFKYSGPTTNDGRNPIYFKYGLYRSFVSVYGNKTPPTLVAYYRDVVKGRTRDEVENFRW